MIISFDYLSIWLAPTRAIVAFEATLNYSFVITLAKCLQMSI